MGTTTKNTNTNYRKYDEFSRCLTPHNIWNLKGNEIFVFGSNLQGMHGGGAARVAVERFGAVMGQGVGLQGQSSGRNWFDLEQFIYEMALENKKHNNILKAIVLVVSWLTLSPLMLVVFLSLI